MKDPSSNSGKPGFDKLTADILRKYRQGALTNREMHQVEKMLLDDPFAAEALEGMETIDNTVDLELIESDLNQRVASRVDKGKSKVIPIYQRPWNIAAALALLSVASYLLFNNTNLLNPSSTESQGPIALEKSTEPEKSQEIEELENNEKEEKSGFIVENDTALREDQSGRAQQPDQAANQDFRSKSLKDDQPAAPAVSQSDKKISPADVDREEETIEEPDTNLDLALAEDNGKDADEIAQTKTGAQNELKKREVQAPVAERSEERISSRSVKKADKLSIDKTASQVKDKLSFRKTISGQVISAEDGRGLPGVNLSINKSNKGVTDINGYYELPLNEPDSILTYSFIGYETEEVAINDQERIDVALEPDEMALEEVVVVAYGNERTNEEFIPVISAEPQGGGARYKRYLKDSLRYPADALDNKIEGKVKVTFFVRSDGKLSDFKVKRSLGHGCDEEVIRLIREGPDWQPAKKGEMQIKQKVRVKVRFKLEK